MEKLQKIQRCIHVLYECDDNQSCDALQQLEQECNALLASNNCNKQLCVGLCGRLETFMRQNRNKRN